MLSSVTAQTNLFSVIRCYVCKFVQEIFIDKKRKVYYSIKRVRYA